MKNHRTVVSFTGAASMPGTLSGQVLAGLIALSCLAATARADGDRAERYQQVNLVADVPGVAMVTDTNLVNAWGVSFSATSPFWVSDNGMGVATLYAVTNDPMGMVQVTKQALTVTIPGEGNPTGQLFNGSGAFHNDIFIFASEDGTISGWRGALGTTAEVLTNRSTAVYKSITLISNAMGPMLIAGNFAEGTLDVYDSSMKLTQFKDLDAPDGYAPFNVQSLGGIVFVTFAKQDAAKHDDVAGPGNGLIDTFDITTGMFRRFATGTGAGGNVHAMNSPWGLAIAPKGFGKHGDQLLVGNFGAGTIMSFDDHGRFRGVLQGAHGGPVRIDGLWALTFGNGGRGGNPDTLYFTAGPDDESHGLFGSLEPVKGREHGMGHQNDDND